TNAKGGSATPEKPRPTTKRWRAPSLRKYELVVVLCTGITRSTKAPRDPHVRIIGRVVAVSYEESAELPKEVGGDRVVVSHVHRIDEEVVGDDRREVPLGD